MALNKNVCHINIESKITGLCGRKKSNQSPHDTSQAMRKHSGQREKVDQTGCIMGVQQVS